jgi:hypothetical protein
LGDEKPAPESARLSEGQFIIGWLFVRPANRSVLRLCAPTLISFIPFIPSPPPSLFTDFMRVIFLDLPPWPDLPSVFFFSDQAEEALFRDGYRQLGGQSERASSQSGVDDENIFEKNDLREGLQRKGKRQSGSLAGTRSRNGRAGKPTFELKRYNA